MTLLGNFEDVYKITISTTHFYYGFDTWEIFVGVSDSDYEYYGLTENAKKTLVNYIAQSVEKRRASTDSIEIEIVAGKMDGKSFGWRFKGNQIELEDWKLGKTFFLE